MITKCILVVGPESSGTRWIAGILSQHPDILGSEGDHGDPLDAFWQFQQDDIPNELFASPHKALLTRRSIPAAKEAGQPAAYMDFDDYSRLSQECDRKRLELIVLITTRSPLANIGSWTTSRASVAGSKTKAIEQYRAAYTHLFTWLSGKTSFWFLSLEGAIYEGSSYFESIFALLELNPHRVSISSNAGVNIRQYDSWQSLKTSHATTNTKYFLSESGEGRKLLSKGWATPERAHVWTVGKSSELVLGVDREELQAMASEAISLEIELKPWVHEKNLSEQHLVISVNGETIFSKALNKATLLRIPVPLTTLLRETPIRITMLHPNATVPANILSDSNERKEIAFAVYWVMLKVD